MISFSDLCRRIDKKGQHIQTTKLKQHATEDCKSILINLGIPIPVYFQYLQLHNGFRSHGSDRHGSDRNGIILRSEMRACVRAVLQLCDGTVATKKDSLSDSFTSLSFTKHLTQNDERK